jgi:hypothetical protein
MTMAVEVAKVRLTWEHTHFLNPCHVELSITWNKEVVF